MSQTIKQNDEVIARECRFAVHIPTKSPDFPDLHVVKEQVHYADGSIRPNVRLIKDYKRPFYVTRKGFQNHEQKKEWESLEKLQKFESTQSKLRDAVAAALDKTWSKEQLRQLSNSPFLYGTDISSTALIKKQYMMKYPDAQTPYSVAFFDTETDVLFGTNHVIMAVIVFKDQVVSAIQKSFLAGISDVENKIAVAQEKQRSDYIEDFTNRIQKLQAKESLSQKDKDQLKGMEAMIERAKRWTFETHICETEYDCIKLTIDKAHEWKPDFLSIWNLDFDISRLMEACERAGVDPKDLFSDPAIPKSARFFKYRQGPKKKVTASGKVVPVNPAAQWHTVECPSSFYVIDGMCCYKHIRMGAQEEPSYSLDAILKKKLSIGKLKFSEADAYQGLRWHQFMQTNYKVEYVIYNRFDCLSMLELDIVLKDIAFTLASYSDASDFASFKSQPKRIADALHFVCLEEGCVIGSCGISNDDEDDEDENNVETLGLRGWILTLAAHNVVDNGVQCIAEDPTIRTAIRAYVFDNDAVSAYPTAVTVANVSKETTRRELSDVEGIDNYVFRMQNINLFSGSVNALEYCQTMFNLPALPELHKLYQQSKHNV